MPRIKVLPSDLPLPHDRRFYSVLGEEGSLRGPYGPFSLDDLRQEFSALGLGPSDIQNFWIKSEPATLWNWRCLIVKFLTTIRDQSDACQGRRVPGGECGGYDERAEEIMPCSMAYRVKSAVVFRCSSRPSVAL